MKRLGTSVAIICFCMASAATLHAACGVRPGTTLGLVPLTFQLPWVNSAQVRQSAPADKTGQSDSIVGLWLVTFESDGEAFDQGYDQWHSDGTEILNDTAPPQPANGAGTICLGVYKKLGTGTYMLRHPFWEFDANGNLSDTGVYLENITVDESDDGYQGSFVFNLYDLSGTLVYTASGTLKATRITPD